MQDYEIRKAFAAFKVDTPTLEPLPVEASTKPTAIRSGRLNYTQVGVCPYCNQPMSKTIACNQEVYVCKDDRFVSPLANDAASEAQ